MAELTKIITKRSLTFLALSYDFAFSRKRALTYLTIPCLLSSLIVTLLSYYYPLGNRQTIYLSIINSLPAAWMLAAVMMLAIDHARGGKSSLIGTSWRAVIFLPKVYFSFLAVLMFIASAIANPFLVFFAVFFVWAPAFAVADTYYVPPVRNDEEEEEGDLFDEDDEMPLARKTPPVRSALFSEPWNIGLVRSINLASMQMLPTLLIAMLFWLVQVLPLSGVQMVTSGEVNVLSLTLQVAVSSLLKAFALGMWASLFVLILPQPVGHDLGFLPSENLFDWNNCNPYFRRATTLFLALGLGVAATVHLIYQEKLARDMPNNTTITLNKAYVEDGNLVLRLLVSDVSHKYRWLMAEGFVVAITDPQKDVIQFSDNMLFNGLAVQNLKFITPDRSMLVAYDSNGDEIPLDALAPRSGALEIVSRYPLPERDALAQFSYALFYSNQLSGSKRGPLIKGLINYKDASHDHGFLVYVSHYQDSGYRQDFGGPLSSAGGICVHVDHGPAFCAQLFGRQRCYPGCAILPRLF